MLPLPIALIFSAGTALSDAQPWVDRLINAFGAGMSRKSRLSRRGTTSSNPLPSSAESGANHGAAEATWAQPDASHTIIFIAGLEDHRVPLWARKLQLEVFSFRRSRRYDNECSLCPLKGYHGYPT